MSHSDEKTYAFGTSSTAVSLMARRSAEVHGAFALPYLESGMRLLDIGCGPGTITVGLAQHVAPGPAVGLDLDTAQTAIGAEMATDQELTNCSFREGSVLALPFDDDSFDVVFGHTILMQFREPYHVLREVRRVLGPQGIVAFREVDFDCSLVYPPDSAMARLWATIARSVEANDGFPNIGRQLSAIVSDEGFELLRSTASFSGPSTPEEKRGFYEAQSRLVEEAGFVKQAIEQGWMSEADRAVMRDALLVESTTPGAFFANAFAEVVARAG